MHAKTSLLAGVALMALSACDTGSFVSREAGYVVDTGAFGNATMQNSMVMMGEWDATMALAAQQRDMIRAGAATAQEVAHQRVVPADVVDVEAKAIP